MESDEPRGIVRVAVVAAEIRRFMASGEKFTEQIDRVPRLWVVFSNSVYVYLHTDADIVLPERGRFECMLRNDVNLSRMVVSFWCFT